MKTNTQPKYIIGINAESETTVNDIAISDEILEEADWEVRDIKDFLYNLEDWIVEAKRRDNGDYELMKADQKMLMGYEDTNKYMFSSQSTNAYMLPSDNEMKFNTLCEELLEEVKSIGKTIKWLCTFSGDADFTKGEIYIEDKSGVLVDDFKTLRNLPHIYNELGTSYPKFTKQ